MAPKQGPHIVLQLLAAMGGVSGGHVQASTEGQPGGTLWAGALCPLHTQPGWSQGVSGWQVPPLVCKQGPYVALQVLATTGGVGVGMCAAQRYCSGTWGTRGWGVNALLATMGVGPQAAGAWQPQWGPNQPPMSS